MVKPEMAVWLSKVLEENENVFIDWQVIKKYLDSRELKLIFEEVLDKENLTREMKNRLIDELEEKTYDLITDLMGV